MSQNLFGIETRALAVYEHRAALLAKNIANSSTPHYKAQDIDFQKELKSIQSSTVLIGTQVGHLQPANQAARETVGYRVPMQVSMDNNTVDDEIERKNFLDNAIRYQAALSFTQSKLHQLISAIRGE